MMKITLTNKQKQTLIIQHGTTRDGRVRDRIKAVIHASNGWSPEEIADALLIHETTVRKHLQHYQLSNRLKPENGGSLGNNMAVITWPYMDAQLPSRQYSLN